jgi:hypothetical protein
MEQKSSREAAKQVENFMPFTGLEISSRLIEN